MRTSNFFQSQKSDSTIASANRDVFWVLSRSFRVHVLANLCHSPSIHCRHTSYQIILICSNLYYFTRVLPIHTPTYLVIIEYLFRKNYTWYCAWLPLQVILVSHRFFNNNYLFDLAKSRPIFNEQINIGDIKPNCSLECQYQCVRNDTFCGWGLLYFVTHIKNAIFHWST